MEFTNLHNFGKSWARHLAHIQVHHLCPTCAPSSHRWIKDRAHQCSRACHAHGSCALIHSQPFRAEMPPPLIIACAIGRLISRAPNVQIHAQRGFIPAVPHPYACDRMADRRRLHTHPITMLNHRTRGSQPPSSHRVTSPSRDRAHPLCYPDDLARTPPRDPLLWPIKTLKLRRRQLLNCRV